MIVAHAHPPMLAAARQRRTSFTCPPGSQPVCPPGQPCYCDDYGFAGTHIARGNVRGYLSSLATGSLNGDSMSSGTVAVLLGATIVIGTIGYLASQGHRNRNPHRALARKTMRLSGARRRYR